MSFPTSPTNGQVTVVNQVSYQYSSATNSWTRILSTANVITANTIAVNGALTVGTTISAAGNITGSYYFGNGSQLTGVAAASAGFPITSGTSNIAAPVANGNIAITVGGTANVAVFATTGEYITGLLSASGNVTGANLNTGGLVTATGNIQGGNLLTGGLVSATGTVTGSTLIGSVVTASGNITGGNVLTGGLISATSTITSAANITGGNILTAGLVSATGNAIFGNISTSGSGGNISGANVISGTTLSATANVIGGNVTTAGLITATGNITGGNVLTAGLVSATGNVTGNYILGNGAFLSGVITSVANINNGNSNVSIYAAGANVAVSVGNVANVAVFSTAGEYISGLLSVSGNVTGGNVLTGGLLSATGTVTGSTLIGTVVTASGNVTGGNVLTAGLVSATGTVTGSTLIGTVVTATGNISGGNVLTGGLISATSTITSAANITGGNLLTAGLVSATGAITSAANVNANNVIATTIVNAPSHTGTIVSVTGNVTGGNILTGGLISATSTITSAANITGGNVLTGGLVSATGTITSAANITGGNLLTGGLISSTGTATVGNLATSGTASATGNVTGGNINTGGLVTATGNISGGNISTSGIVTAAGNVFGNNIFATTSVSTAGNVIAGNVNTATIRPTSGALTISTGTGNINLNPAGNIVLTANTYINNVQTPVQDGDAASKYYVDTIASSGITYHQAVYVATTANLATTTGGTITYTQPNGVANGIGAKLTTTGSFNLIDTGNVQTVGTRILVKDEGNAVYNGVYTWSNATAIVRSTDADEYGANSAEQFSINDYFFTTNGNVNAGTAFVVSAPPGTITFGTSNISFSTFSTSQVYSANTLAGLSLTGTVFSAKVDNNTTAFDGTGNIIVKAGANLTTPNIGAATGTSLNVTANVDAGNLRATGLVSAAANVTGGNITTGGVVTATGNVTGGNLLTAGLVSATGTITGSSLLGSVVSVTANITGGNLLTGGLISATSTITSAANITGGNLLTAGIISATGTITTAGNLSLTGNIVDTGELWINTTANGNINLNPNGTGQTNIPAGILSVTGNIQGGNLRTAGLVSATGNVTGGNVLTGGLISATSTITSAANITGGNLLTGGLVSATANVTGGNLLTGGLISATSTITSAANITGGNILTAGLISATANITGDNVLTAGLVSATGNVTGNYILGNGAFLSGVITSVANINNGTSNVSIYAANANVAVSVGGTSNVAVFATTGEYITGLLSVSGNVTGGNVLTGGLVSATGTITSAANITGGNLLTGGLISSTGTITGSSHLGSVVSVTGNITGGNITTTGLISTTGNIAGGNILSNNYYYANGQAIVFGVNYTAATTPPSSPANGWQWYNTSTDVLYEYLSDGTTPYWVDISSPAFAAGVVANVAISGSMLVNANATYDIGSASQTFRNVYAQNYYGNGATLTGIITSVSNINNGTSNVTVVSSGGNIAASVGGTSNVMVISSGAVAITGDLSVSGNASLTGNIVGDAIYNGTTSIQIQASGGNANVTVGGTSNVAVFATTGEYVTGLISASGNITGGNLTTAGILTVNSGAAATAIVNGASNAVGNIGSTSSYFNRLFAQATTALYADLAENYLGDADYAPGTVVDFGGTQEVTISTVDSSKRVAGVVSTNPAHLMNAGVVGEHVVTVALIGRVPVSVTGTVRKGDLMVSAGDGTAKAVTIASPKVGTIIGKSLEDFDGDKGTIEIVIGKH